MYINALFPSRKKLEEQYPRVKKNAFWIPFVWLHRLVFLGGCAVKSGALTTYLVTDAKGIADLGQKRGEMFKMLGMLE